ncbi:FtsK/SpoIIIE domain-containing protein [Geobacter benzoatilyticus]|uniref:DNA translocase FtsK n=1 Tax=Geobacter benzoatilyticus TaxID=2815309 RepID=A0ABX7Q269_9BACT|nr:FtsK/SpoIIIE domain-containing protein [Geobacter benzoatilyticus]QSV45479.1 DNA translocase FtsK [Geobacter benzoatilyticus]
MPIPNDQIQYQAADLEQAGITYTDRIVGTVAFRLTAARFTPLLEDSEFNGAFFVLSGFTGAQLAGFIQAAQHTGTYWGHLRIGFPASELTGYNIPEECLVQTSAVSVRNADRQGKIVITTDSEPDVGSSLSNKITIKADQLKEADEAPAHWIHVVSDVIGLALPPEPAKQVGAMIKGLFECGRFPIGTAARYILQVLSSYKDGTPLLRASGMHLPALDLPLFEDCFMSLGSVKSGQPSQWRKLFEDHQKQDCYLNKRYPTGLLLDPDHLRKNLNSLRNDNAGPNIPDNVLDAFAVYIEAEGTRSQATETFLFGHDWSIVRNCFDKQRKTTSRSFVEKTRKILEVCGITPTDDDEAVLKALEQNPRKSGGATDEYREFFETYSDDISHDPKLLFDWEDFVYGQRIICSDLFEGILDCLQRTLRLRTPDQAAWLVIQGVRQQKPLHFASANRQACEYFERHYGKLPEHSKQLIRFEKTNLPVYSSEVRPKLDSAPKTRKAGGRTTPNSFEFQVTLFERLGGNETRVATLPLIWMFPKDSVLAQEGADLDALCRYQKRTRTAFAEGLANYETVGRKGIPLMLSLNSVQGFASPPGASGRGRFIPAQTRINSLAAEFTTIIDQSESNRSLPEEIAKGLRTAFSDFNNVYGSAVESLAYDALERKYATGTAAAYRGLLSLIRTVPNENIRYRILRTVLRIGTVTVAESGHRPKVAVVCPWHPVRMEAAAARNEQLLDTITGLLTEREIVFSDGTAGTLFFREMREMLNYPLEPEIAVCWENMEPLMRVATQSIGAYTLHEPVDLGVASRSLEDNAAESAKTILGEIQEYLRLQPHERDNLSVLLYNCDSPELPSTLVECLNKLNRESKDGAVTCHVLLMHHDETHLRHLYRDLVARSDNDTEDSVETTGDFLSKVRINIAAASRLRREGRSQPVDIAYCRDLLSAEAKTEWVWIDRDRHTVPPVNHRPHQWNRLRPFREGDRIVRVLLCCPAHTETGWSYLHAIASMCTNGADIAWANMQCPVPMRTLNFDNHGVDRILRETHDLAVWVVNQDELLDRRLLEQKQVKVIRYIQSTTQGRNLIISSKARDTLLVNTLKERLRTILPFDTTDAVIQSLVKRLLDDANGISGGLVLKAARRANNTNELFGMVLSRYLIQSELGYDRAAAWCFLDDFSNWLGKKEGTNIADLLVLAPKWQPDGTPHLDIIVTEAKFVTYEGVSAAARTSEKQLSDTLIQISEALIPEPSPFDQQVWLARISDMILSRTTGTLGQGEPGSFEPEKWRSMVRNRECTFSIWGYSHVFIHSPMDLDAPVSVCKGIETQRGKTKVQALQEVFGPDLTRSILLQMNEDKHDETRLVRTQLGHPGFNASLVRKLSSEKPEVFKPQEGSSDGLSSVTPNETLPLEVVSAGQSEPREPTQSLQGIVPSAVVGEEQAQRPILLEGDLRKDLNEYLIQCASKATASIEEGQLWLEKTTADLRSALLARGLSAKLAEDFKPILTPNAAIIKLQGAKDMTVQAVEAKAEEIFTSSGIHIISVMPESGRVSISIARPDRQILHYAQVLVELFKSSPDITYREQLLVGIREEDGRPMFLDPLKQPHTLVAGITGSGKSVLIQNLILYIALTKSPDEAHIHLIDAKFGVDYRPLDLLPHVAAGSQTIIDEPTAAIVTLEELVGEMDRRYQLFKEAKVKDYRDYRKATGQVLPTLWVIHDEFADWMQTDDYADRVPDLVGRLSIKARAAGIFLIFAAQRPDNTVMPMQLRSQLGNRLILKVDSPGTSEVSMGEKNAGAEKLLGQGHMLVKTGDTPHPIFVQVPYLDMSEVPRIVQLLRLIHGLRPSEELPWP